MESGAVQKCHVQVRGRSTSLFGDAEHINLQSLHACDIVGDMYWAPQETGAISTSVILR